MQAAANLDNLCAVTNAMTFNTAYQNGACSSYGTLNAAVTADLISGIYIAGSPDPFSGGAQVLMGVFGTPDAWVVWYPKGTPYCTGGASCTSALAPSQRMFFASGDAQGGSALYGDNFNADGNTVWLNAVTLLASCMLALLLFSLRCFSPLFSLLAHFVCVCVLQQITPRAHRISL